MEMDVSHLPWRRAVPSRRRAAQGPKRVAHSDPGQRLRRVCRAADYYL